MNTRYTLLASILILACMLFQSAIAGSVSNPYPSNGAIDVPLQPTLRIDVYTNGSANLYWYEGNYTTLTQIKYYDVNTSHQGTAASNIFLFTTYAGTNNRPGYIYKYWLSNSTEVKHIGSLNNSLSDFYFEDPCIADNKLYVPLVNYAYTPRKTIIRVYDLDLNLLEQINISDLLGINFWSGSIAFHDNHFWLTANIASSDLEIFELDKNFSLINRYNLTADGWTDATNSEPQGITWLSGNDILFTHHSDGTYFAPERWHYNGSNFTKEYIYNSSVEIDQGLDYHPETGILYAVRRLGDDVVAFKFTGYILAQINSSITNGRYSWQYSDATEYNSTYYWKVSIDDGTTNTSEEYHFTTDINGSQSSISVLDSATFTMEATVNESPSPSLTLLDSKTFTMSAVVLNESVNNGSGFIVTNSNTPYYVMAGMLVFFPFLAIVYKKWR